MKFAENNGTFIDAVKSIQLYIQEAIPLPIRMDTSGKFHETICGNYKLIRVKCVVSLHILSSIFCILVWTNSEVSEQFDLVNLFIAIFYLLVGMLPMVLTFTVNNFPNELCFVLNEICKELAREQVQHKNASRILFSAVAVVTYTCATSFAVPFTVPNDANVLFLLWITKYFLGTRLSDFCRRLVIIPVISTLSICISFNLMECILIVILATIGILQMARKCSSTNYYNRIQIKMFLTNQIFFVLLPALISVLLLASSLPVSLLVSLWDHLLPHVRFDVATFGGLFLVLLSSVCRNMGNIHEYSSSFLINHVRLAMISRNRIEKRRVLACPKVHMKVGPFGYFDRRISLTFLDATLDNSVRVLLFIENHSST